METHEGLTKAEKIKEFGEVFTPLWIVNQMLDELEQSFPDAFLPQTTYLEPTCGEGVFVCEILRRKFERCKNKQDFRTAIRSIYAFEIQPDNVEKTISAVIELSRQFKPTKEDIQIITDHIIQADALKVMKLLKEVE